MLLLADTINGGECVSVKTETLLFDESEQFYFSIRILVHQEVKDSIENGK